MVIFKKSGAGFEEFFATKRLRVDVSLLALISKTLNLDFAADFADGEITGNFKANADKYQVELVLSDVDLDKVSFFKEAFSKKALSFDVKGHVDGEIFLTVPVAGKDVESDFDLQFKTMQMTDVKLQTDPDQIASIISLPDMDLSSSDNPVRLQGNLESGQLRILDFTVPGPDLDLQLKGKLNLKIDKTEVSVTRTDIKGRFVFSDKVNEGVPILSLLNPQKGTDGYFPLAVTGRLDKPSIRIGELDLSQVLGL